MLRSSRFVGATMVLLCAGVGRAEPIDDDWMARLLPYDRRLATVAHRVAVAAAPHCPRRRAAAGFDIVDRSQFRRRDWPQAQRTYRLGDRPAVLTVVAGSPAARADLRPGDTLLTIGGMPVASARPRRDPLAAILAQLDTAAATGLMQLSVLREQDVHAITYRPDIACAARFVIGRSDTPDAAVSGDVVEVNIGLMNFTDDAGLAGVLAHELAHIALGTDEGTARDPVVARQQEDAADRLSVAILRRAGYGVDGIVRFWQRMAAGEGGRYRTRRHLPPLERAAAIAAEAARLTADQTPR